MGRGTHKVYGSVLVCEHGPTMNSKDSMRVQMYVYADGIGIEWINEHVESYFWAS